MYKNYKGNECFFINELSGVFYNYNCIVKNIYGLTWDYLTAHKEFLKKYKDLDILIDNILGKKVSIKFSNKEFYILSAKYNTDKSKIKLIISLID